MVGHQSFDASYCLQLWVEVYAHHEEGGRMVLQNISILPHQHMVEEPRRPWLKV